MKVFEPLDLKKIAVGELTSRKFTTPPHDLTLHELVRWRIVQ